MSKCVELESSMTGSTGAGPLKPPVSSSPLNSVYKRSSSGHRPLDDEPAILHSPSRQEQTPILHKMTPVRLHSGQPIQLTPLWEHVVRTRRFPCEIDTRETFDEITERLRDPEWEVRQHALRVLVDVLPTLDLAIIDDAMTTVLPELVNNLGHLAPAVRKGALDTLRVYLLCSRRREDIVDLILNEALIQQDALASVRANITLGVILSTPSLLFPSSSNSRPSDETIRRAIGALVSRLIQVTHQEAALRSLVKIQELLGTEDFYFYLNELDMYAKRDYEILCDVYKIKPSVKSARRRKRSPRTKKQEIDGELRSDEREESAVGPTCDSGREVSEPLVKNREALVPSSPGSRILLETEIKFNEETAIKMTIFEQNDNDIDAEFDFEWHENFPRDAEEDIAPETRLDEPYAKEDEIKDEWIEKRKTPRRVHFGGEIVKLRTPDSDDSELAQPDTLQTRIPIPVEPASTAVRSRKSRSNPGSPNVVRSRSRKSKSVANSPRREFYIHDASLSPKKSILARRNDESTRKMEARVDTIFGRQESREGSGWAFEIFDNDDYSNSNLVRLSPVEYSSSPKSKREASKKERIARPNSDGSRNGEIGKTKMEASPRKLNNLLPVSEPESTLKKDTAKCPTQPTNDRFHNGGADFDNTDQRIGNVPVNENSKIADRMKKERYSAKANSDGSRNGEIGKTKMEASPRKLDDLLPVSEPESTLKKDTAKCPTQPTNDRFHNGGADFDNTDQRIGNVPVNENSKIADRMKKERYSAKANSDGSRNGEIGKTKMEASPRKLDDLLPISEPESTLKKDTAKCQTQPTNDRFHNGGADFDNTDERIGNVPVNENSKTADRMKKERYSARPNSDGSRNGEIGKTKMEASPRKLDDLLPVSEPESTGKRDTAKCPTEPTNDRFHTGGADFDNTDERIGNISVNENSNITGRSSINSSPEKTPAKKSAKHRNSARPKTGPSKMNEISKNATIGTTKPEHLEDNGMDFSGPLADTSGKIGQRSKDSTVLSNEVNSSAELRDVTVNRKIGTVANEAVGRLESAPGSPVKLKSSREKSAEEKQESRGSKSPSVSSDETSSRLQTQCEKVEEKFKSTNERSGESYSIDSPLRVSPRSLKKHEFEAFPRKERNYIFMELSSPVKTSSRRTSESEKIDEPKSLDASENNSSPSHDRSPTNPSIDQPMAYLTNDRSIDAFTVSTDNSTTKKSVSEKMSVDAGEKTAAEQYERPKEVEAFELEVNSLNDIVIAEPPKFRESNWEDLGLVDQDVLDDLHNKDDWRARVRGLERVASALRTPSALVAIEPRLGSLLQAVLGGERSCRVAAAGMAVARIVVAGVSEEALKRRLPQVAWGLARQGGPNAAQLARVAMLRLRPALLFEQLLQPHCIKARNAKTRENALQLLIFSLVTFPSTEFKVENVAYKVASMVADKRRRVRQATLDTLAVLAQIYEPEEVTKAGKLAAKGQRDGDAMLAAIRARLARKSLPMVSADGLVLYGLQISPTIQIATGPDVDWIVAGSGSVSPGTGRTRGQIIATTPRQDKNPKTDHSKSVSASRRLNFVALGVAIETKNEREKPPARKFVQHSAQHEARRTREELSGDNGDGDIENCEKFVTKTRLTGTLRQYRSATDRLDLTYEANEANPICLIDDRDVIMKQRQTEENFHRRMDEIYPERTGIGPISQDTGGNRLESRIPVPQMRDRDTKGKEATRIGAIHPTRRLPQKGNNSQNWSAGSRVSDVSRPQSTHRDDHSPADINSQRYERTARDPSPRHLSPTGDTYRSIYRQGRGFADGNVYREVQTAPTNTSYDVTRRRQSLKDSSATRYLPGSRRSISDESQGSSTTMTTVSSNDNDMARTSRMPNGKRAGNSIFHKGDKNTIEEEENNEANKRHHAVQANSYQIRNSNDRSSQCPVRKAQINNDPSETSSNESSNTVLGEYERSEILEKLPDDRACVEEAFTIENDENVVPSLPKSPGVEKSFDVITHETNPSRRNSIECGISQRSIHLSTVACTLDQEIDESETEKDSSTEDSSTVLVIPRTRSSHENFTINHDSESSDIEETASGLGRNYETAYVTNDTNSLDDGVSKVSDSSSLPGGSRETEVDLCESSKNSARVDSVYAIRSIEVIDTDNSSPSTDDIDGVEVTTTSYVAEYPEDVPLKSGMRLISQHIPDGSPARSDDQRSQESRRESRDRDENVISIILASRPHSRDSYSREDKISIGSLDFRQSPPQSVVGRSPEISCSHSSKLDEPTNDSGSMEISASEKPTIRPSYSRDSTDLEKIDGTSNTGNESATLLPEANGSQASMSQMKQIQKSVPTSRISRMRQKSRTNMARVAPMQPSGQTIDRGTSKSRMLAQQCFTQLDSNDWEVTVKGLKGLSQIARQQPEQLDSCAPGTLGRLLGRHVRNLRSQVSRAACLAASDVFGSQARCIDQDLDDIAGPLLHRTADTNKFLRADSNEALDRMVQHLPPNKTIAVIVHRGGTHQNAIVRATTARLLASIVDRVGPDWTMSMPRDAREKLIATGAKLLMDGNLEARNQAKRMFRKLSGCEGFRKVLRDSVPDTTLRHIDKTLRSL